MSNQKMLAFYYALLAKQHKRAGKLCSSAGKNWRTRGSSVWISKWLNVATKGSKPQAKQPPWKLKEKMNLGHFRMPFFFLFNFGGLYELYANWHRDIELSWLLLLQMESFWYVQVEDRPPSSLAIHFKHVKLRFFSMSKSCLRALVLGYGIP